MGGGEGEMQGGEMQGGNARHPKKASNKLTLDSLITVQKKVRDFFGIIRAPQKLHEKDVQFFSGIVVILWGTATSKFEYLQSLIVEHAGISEQSGILSENL